MISDGKKKTKSSKGGRLTGWSALEGALSEPFWTTRGLAAICPWCGSASDQGKMRFLITVDRNASDMPIFKGFLCLVCNESGGGRYGITKLMKQLGLSYSLGDLEEFSGSGRKNFSYSENLIVSDGDKPSAVEVIEWPPDWAEATVATENAARRYLANRNIEIAPKLLDSGFLIVTDVIPSTKGSGEQAPFPGIVAPMERAPGEVVGWIARRISLKDYAPTQESEKLGLPDKMSADGSEWRKHALFGLSVINPDKPVSIVEGMMTSLATPNSVALSGKAFFPDQARILDSIGVEVILEALDPDAPLKTRVALRESIKLAAPSLKVFGIDWTRYGIEPPVDAADLGRQIMSDIINDTLRIVSSAGAVPDVKERLERYMRQQNEPRQKSGQKSSQGDGRSGFMRKSFREEK